MEITALQLPRRHRESIQRTAAAANATNKINYVVPVGKNLFIEWWTVCIEEGDKMIIEIQDDGTGLDCLGNGEGKSGGDVHLFPQYNPLGSETPIAPGSTVRLSRVEGATGKAWGGGFMGYLEDDS